MKSRKDLWASLQRLNKIQSNLEKKRIIVENDWKALDDENEAVKKVTASRLMEDFEEFEKVASQPPPKNKSWFNNMMDFLFR
jgi:hypothetical protein